MQVSHSFQVFTVTVVVAEIACNGNYNFHCVNCTTLMTCVDGIAYPDTMTNCPSDTQCNILSPYGCDGLNGCKLPEFECSDTGVFADRENCSMYHMCKNNGTNYYYHFVYACPKGSLFDAGSSKCVMEGETDCSQLSLLY